MPGNVLLLHNVLPSTLRCLTSVFGMGTGVSILPSSPDKLNYNKIGIKCKYLNKNKKRHCCLLDKNIYRKIAWQRPTLAQCTTIGAKMLNFRVRYGNGCVHLAIITRLFFQNQIKLIKSFLQVKSSCSQYQSAPYITVLPHLAYQPHSI